MLYYAFVTKEEGYGYPIIYPGIVGLYTQPDTLEETFPKVKEGLTLHLEGYLMEGLSIPSQVSFEECMTHPDVVGKSGFWIAVEIDESELKAHGGLDWCVHLKLDGQKITDITLVHCEEGTGRMIIGSLDHPDGPFGTLIITPATLKAARARHDTLYPDGVIINDLIPGWEKWFDQKPPMDRRMSYHLISPLEERGFKPDPPVTAKSTIINNRWEHLNKERLADLRDEMGLREQLRAFYTQFNSAYFKSPSTKVRTDGSVYYRGIKFIVPPNVDEKYIYHHIDVHLRECLQVCGATIHIWPDNEPYLPHVEQPVMGSLELALMDNINHPIMEVSRSGRTFHFHQFVYEVLTDITFNGLLAWGTVWFGGRRGVHPQVIERRASEALSQFLYEHDNKRVELFLEEEKRLLRDFYKNIEVS